MSHASLRATLVAFVLVAVACSDDSVETQQIEAQDLGDDALEVADMSDAGEPQDATPDGSPDVSRDTAALADMMRVDSGPDEPCENGICTLQDCIANGWVPPGNLQRDTQLILNDEMTTLTWQQFFGQPFPGGNARILEVEPDRFAAIEFSTAGLRGAGAIVFDNPQAAGPWGSRLFTINQCPGYFGPSPYPDDAECREWRFAVGNMSFTVGADSDSSSDCDLRPDRTYYLNIVFVDEVLPVGSEDLTWRCGLGDMVDETWETCGALMEQNFAPR